MTGIGTPFSGAEYRVAVGEKVEIELLAGANNAGQVVCVCMCVHVCTCVCVRDVVCVCLPFASLSRLLPFALALSVALKRTLSHQHAV